MDKNFFLDKKDVSKLDFTINTYPVTYDPLGFKDIYLDDNNFDFKSRILNFGVMNNIRGKSFVEDKDFTARDYSDGFTSIDFEINYRQTGVAVLSYYCETVYIARLYPQPTLRTEINWIKKFCFVFNFKKNKWVYADWNQKNNPLCKEYKNRKNLDENFRGNYLNLVYKTWYDVSDFYKFIQTEKNKFTVLRNFVLSNHIFRNYIKMMFYLQKIKYQQMLYLIRYIDELNSDILESLYSNNNTSQINSYNAIQNLFYRRNLKIDKSNLFLGYYPTIKYQNEINFLIPSLAQLLFSSSKTKEYWNAFLEKELEKELTEIIFNNKKIERIHRNFFL